MTDRFDTPTGAAYPPHDEVEDAPPTSTDIDDLIARLRAAHYAGTTINELNARLGSIITGMPTGEPPLKSSPPAAAVPFPLPESNPATEEIAQEQRRSSCPGSEVWQSPATRSKPQQPHEKTRKSATSGADICAWATVVGHNDALGAAINHENRAESRPQQWVTNVGHKRSIRGLYRRGSIYQFRVRQKSPGIPHPIRRPGSGEADSAPPRQPHLVI